MADDDVGLPKTSVPINDVVWRTTVDRSDSTTVSVVRLTAVDMSAGATVDLSELGTVDRCGAVASGIGAVWAGEFCNDGRGSLKGRTYENPGPIFTTWDRPFWMWRSSTAL